MPFIPGMCMIKIPNCTKFCSNREKTLYLVMIMKFILLNSHVNVSLVQYSGETAAKKHVMGQEKYLLLVSKINKIVMCVNTIVRNLIAVHNAQEIHLIMSKTNTTALNVNVSVQLIVMQNVVVKALVYMDQKMSQAVTLNVKDVKLEQVLKLYTTTELMVFLLQ